MPVPGGLMSRAHPLAGQNVILIASWFAFGAFVGLTLPRWLSGPQLLVLGVTAAGAGLLRLLGPSRYCAAALVGAGLGPLQFALDRTSRPPGCELAVCPHEQWLRLLAGACSLVLVATGLWLLHPSKALEARSFADSQD